MRRLLPLICGLVAWGLAAACGKGTFYAEVDEPKLCTYIYDSGFPATQPGADLIGVAPIPVGDIANYFKAAGNTTVDLRLTSLRLSAGEGIADFNSIETASVSLISGDLDAGIFPDGGFVPDAGLTLVNLLTYQQDPNNLPFLTLTIGDPQPVNLANYLDPSGNIEVVAIMDGGLPNNEWYADVQACFSLTARVDYLAKWNF